ncbi:MAG TPA: TolC family protein [Polyangiaceae bacterium]|nr:TolC family protein [Polyangiaceae bacterium]
MTKKTCFRRRPWARAAACLLLTGAASAQVPSAPADAGTAPPAPAPAAATSEPAAARALGVNINDFENRPLSSVGAQGYSLERCIALTLQNYPRIHEARQRLEYRKGQRLQSWTQPYSEFNVTGGLGIAPEVRGTTIYSPDTDVAFSSHMGLGWSIGIDGVIPLWTFGKITNLWDAADAQVKVAEQDIEKEKNNIKLDVRRAYYGVQLARDAMALMREAESRVDKYLGTLEKKVKTGDADEAAFYKLKMNRADLTARHSEARQKEAIALASLKFLTGVKGELTLPERPLVRVRQALSPLATYLSAARLHRPEINMARAGLIAREAQVRMEQARYYPDLGLGVSARWAKAPGVTDQTNPFVHDTANVIAYGAALVLRYKLDFLPTAARVAQAQAQLEELRATERYALGGVAVEVETAFREAEDAERRLDAYAEAASYAKKWLILVQQGIDVGTNDEEDIVDPAKEWALKRFAVMAATYDYNVAVGKLAMVTGWEGVVASR